MTPAQRLAQAFDRGLSEGVESLSAKERDLYLIQDFIIEQEMNGLSGYFYNRLHNPEQISSAVDAMRRYSLPELAALLNEANELFQGYAESESATTWSDVLHHYDPENRLAIIANKISSLDNYGLEGSAII